MVAARFLFFLGFWLSGSRLLGVGHYQQGFANLAGLCFGGLLGHFADALGFVGQGGLRQQYTRDKRQGAYRTRKMRAIGHRA